MYFTSGWGGVGEGDHSLDDEVESRGKWGGGWYFCGFEFDTIGAIRAVYHPNPVRERPLLYLICADFLVK